MYYRVFNIDKFYHLLCQNFPLVGIFLFKKLFIFDVEKLIPLCMNPKKDKDPFTLGELAVMKYLMLAYDYKGISKLLVISQHTVNTHIRTICLKLNVTTGKQVASLMPSLGFVANHETQNVTYKGVPIDENLRKKRK